MAGRRTSRIRPGVTVLAPRVQDPDTQRALDEIVKALGRPAQEAEAPPPPAPSAPGALAVAYTATGTEGSSFTVPIGATLSSSSYTVVWAPAGIQNVPLLDLPNGPGDRTTTHFRVLIGGEPLQAGETLAFVILPSS